ncbi:cyclin [Cryptosporidium ubiquitum]|uniref:Cyclin n=1 Tax=Cryptosporidium ubiquitum TaxID=857276 RepID=A0A1J4MJ13_9CRYT|nr:cyclin [Cryptosporidium ubiquitum]OII73991.1 cyclin [Cryptosporidium ubiquitum]
MTELEDSINEISSHEWESNLAKIICGSLVSLNELIEDISDEDLNEVLSDQNKFCVFECFFEPLLYYKNKHNLPPNMPKSNDESNEGEFILKNPLYSESENKDLGELFRFGKTPKVSIQELFGFVLSVLHFGGFNVSSFVLSVINMAKFVEKIKIPICQHNWRPIFITSLLLSDKLWDDSCAKSGDLARTVGFISPKTLKYLELIFCEELDWKITFKLDTIKAFISKIVNTKLDSELIERVISSETYQSYCYEGIHDQNAVKYGVSVEKLENKNMMNNSLQSLELAKINNQKIGQKFNQTMNNYRKRSESPSFFNNQNQHQRIPPSILHQPQLQRGMSFHGNHRPFNTQAANSAFINTTATAMPRPMGNQTIIPTSFGANQHHLNLQNSNVKRPSVPMLTPSGGYTTLNRSFYSPARNQMSVNNNNNNSNAVYGSSLNLKNNIASLTSPKSNFTNKTHQYPGLSAVVKTPNSNTLALGRNSNGENFPIGNYIRSVTPDTHFKNKVINSAKNPEVAHSNSNVNLNLSSSNERGRDTSCLSNLKHPTTFHTATRMNSNPNIEQKPSSQSRYSGLIKRSSSEHSRLNPANSQGNQHITQQLPRPPPVPQFRRGGEDGFFSMARNKVSSAFSSITRTFGLSSPESNQINENHFQESNIVLSNSNQISPTNNPNKCELKPVESESSLTKRKIESNSSQDFNQQTSFQEFTHQSNSALISTSSKPAFSNSNQRNLSMPPKSNPVLSQLSEDQQKSALVNKIGITSSSNSCSGVEKTPTQVLSEHHFRALSTERTCINNHNNHQHLFLRQSLGTGYNQIVKNVSSTPNSIPEKQPPVSLSAAWTSNSSYIRAPQTLLHKPSSLSDRFGGNMHVNTGRQSVGRTASQVQNMVSQTPSIGSELFGRAGKTARIGTGVSLNRNMSLVGKNVHSQETNQVNSTQATGTRVPNGIIGSLFNGKPRMQSSGPSNPANTGLRPVSMQPASSKGIFSSSSVSKSSLFSVDNLINPISSFLKGKSPSISSSILKTPGVQIGSGPISTFGLSVRK